MVMTVYALLVLLMVLGFCLNTLWHGRRYRQLADLTTPVVPLPGLSVIVPACNEAASIRATAESILGQDYPDLELILINDRSADATGEIMQQVAAEHPDRVRFLSIDRLPEGWLGKNHALWVGAGQARHSWLLFTDADMQFDPGCFRRAVAQAESEHLDHLSMFPYIVAHGHLLGAFVAYFVGIFFSYNQAPKANDPHSAFGMGCGAFNLIRASAYQTIGTHVPISLRPDDDVRLGMRVKRSGLRQRIFSGTGLAWVVWYPSLWEAVRGLEKSLFAVADYNPVKLAGMCGSLVAFDALPFALVWFARGAAQWLLVAVIALQLIMFIYAGIKSGNRKPAYFLLFPLMALVMTATTIRATWLAYRQGGIYWRGTLYPLHRLRSQTGLEGLPPWNRRSA